MKTSALAWIVVVVALLIGGWYFMIKGTAPVETAPPISDSVAPTGAAGINGSANQGNMGQPDTDSTGSPQGGVVQQPMADGAEGSVIGSNVALGVDKSTKLGTYLIAYNGMTLYTYTKDTGAESTCYDQCAANWPPYVVGPEDNLSQLKEGVVASKVGTTRRTDGSIQVTYDGHPLYFWKNDTKSGDTAGQNVGGVWFVVKP